MNVGNVKFMKVKRLENLDAKKMARIDKMWNDGNPEVKPPYLGQLAKHLNF